MQRAARAQVLFDHPPRALGTPHRAQQLGDQRAVLPVQRAVHGGQAGQHRVVRAGAARRGDTGSQRRDVELVVGQEDQRRLDQRGGPLPVGGAPGRRQRLRGMSRGRVSRTARGAASGDAGQLRAQDARPGAPDGRGAQILRGRVRGRQARQHRLEREPRVQQAAVRAQPLDGYRGWSRVLRCRDRVQIAAPEQGGHLLEGGRGGQRGGRQSAIVELLLRDQRQRRVQDRTFATGERMVGGRGRIRAHLHAPPEPQHVGAQVAAAASATRLLGPDQSAAHVGVERLRLDSECGRGLGGRQKGRVGRYRITHILIY